MSTQYHHGDLKNALIQAGIEILSREGTEALNLRSVAKRVGVSHAAPYAHFADKQALIAAIATAGYASLYGRLAGAAGGKETPPLIRLGAMADAYLQFALSEPDHFKITFSGVVEAEKDYPEYVEQSRRCLELVVGLVQDCQAGGMFAGRDPLLSAISIWSCIHGFVQLLLGNQFPGALAGRESAFALLRAHLQQVLQVDLPVPA